MTGLGEVRMGLHGWLKSEWRWAGGERIFGASESSWFPACEETAGEGPSLCGLFLPGGFSLCLSLVILKDLTLTCWSVLFTLFLWTAQGLSDELIGLLLFYMKEELGRVQAATQHALGPLCQAPFPFWPVRSCRLFLAVNQAPTLSNYAALYSVTRARLRPTNSFSHAT